MEYFHVFTVVPRSSPSSIGRFKYELSLLMHGGKSRPGLTFFQFDPPRKGAPRALCDLCERRGHRLPRAFQYLDQRWRVTVTLHVQRQRVSGKPLTSPSPTVRTCSPLTS